MNICCHSVFNFSTYANPNAFLLSCPFFLQFKVNSMDNWLIFGNIFWFQSLQCEGLWLHYTFIWLIGCSFLMLIFRPPRHSLRSSQYRACWYRQWCMHSYFGTSSLMTLSSLSATGNQDSIITGSGSIYDEEARMKKRLNIT